MSAIATSFSYSLSKVSMHEFMKGSDDLTPRAKMNQHNNNVGREIASQSLETKCKCHGVSSSCSLKTCWKVLPALSIIGEKLVYVHVVQQFFKPHILR